VVEDAEHQHHHHQQDRPLGDVPDRHGGVADAQRAGDGLDHRPGEDDRQQHEREQQDHQQRDEDLQWAQLEEPAALRGLPHDVGRADGESIRFIRRALGASS